MVGLGYGMGKVLVLEFERDFGFGFLGGAVGDVVLAAAIVDADAVGSALLAGVYPGVWIED
jgi:hypothetical protein